MKVDRRDLYEILEVRPNAGPAVIEAAYRALARIFSDKLLEDDNPHLEAVRDAYDVLSNPERRHEYDRQRGDQRGKRIGSFMVLERIAEGSFANIYKGAHISNPGNLACIKHTRHVSSESNEILQAEFDALWNVTHHNIPAMRDLVKLDDGSSALIMSYFSGPTLAEIVEKYGRIDPENVAWIFGRILNPLNRLRFSGIAHTDIKPRNIILRDDIPSMPHMVGLVGFGMGMRQANGSLKVLGYNPYFSPPEQVEGKPFLPESDLYALGMTMIFALNGGDLNLLHNKEVPTTTPAPMVDFIRRLVEPDVLLRPGWDDENLEETFVKARKESFGREHSNFKPLVVNK